MKVVQVLNNNVVLAVREDNQEVIVTGWGVGFGQKPGCQVDPAKITRTFVPESDKDPDLLAHQFAELDPAYLTAVADALGAAAPALRITPGSTSVIALADHFQMAHRRQQLGEELHDHPLAAEVTHLYPVEYAAAKHILAAVTSAVGITLPAQEAVAVALHLVNAGFMTGDLTETYRMTGVFSQLFDIIAATFGLPIDPQSVSAARFITHLRYFFARATSNRQINDGVSVLRASLEATHPAAVDCALKLAAVLELRLGQAVSQDEVAYLALHIARLVAETTTEST